MGILFGYGEHNAELFEKRNEFIKMFPNKRKNTPFKLQPFSSTQLPLNALMINLPQFVADLDNAETKQLKQKYLLQRREILKRYESGDFLEITLQKLCEESF